MVAVAGSLCRVEAIKWLVGGKDNFLRFVPIASSSFKNVAADPRWPVTAGHESRDRARVRGSMKSSRDPSHLPCDCVLRVCENDRCHWVEPHSSLDTLSRLFSCACARPSAQPSSKRATHRCYCTLSGLTPCLSRTCAHSSRSNGSSYHATDQRQIE